MTVDVALNETLRILLAFIFLRAAFHKLRHYRHFCAQAESYRILPSAVLPAFALLLLLLEGSLTFALLHTAWPAPPFIAAAVLALYSVAMLINLARGRTDLDCGCNGPSADPQSISWALVIRNWVLVLLCMVVALPLTARALSIPDFISIFFAAVAAILMYASIEQAIVNQQRSRRFLARNAQDSLGYFE